MLLSEYFGGLRKREREEEEKKKKQSNWSVCQGQTCKIEEPDSPGKPLAAGGGGGGGPDPEEGVGWTGRQ